VKATRNLQRHSIVGGLALALALTAIAPSARANVFASNIKINGGMSNVPVAPGAGVNISYILNEPASAGVTIRILSGAATVRTLSIASGAGTARGTNTVVWDGKTSGGANAPVGNYSVSITAASTGYAGWTKTTDDNNAGNYTWEARGIAVDRNTNSPYYGRVFVDNSYPGPNGMLGDLVGIQKLNADGSYADEGGFSNGGVAWNGQYSAPWRIRVSEDDNVYVGDFYFAGDIYRFDGTISSNSMAHVFAPPADQSLGNWSGFQLAGKGTNTVLWASDANGGFGISKFSLTNGIFDPSNRTQVVAIGGTNGMDVAPYAVALDKAGAIYPAQHIIEQGNGSSPRVLRYPAYDPGTNAPETNADWTVAAADDTAGGQGIAVDPTGTYVAAAFWGYYAPPYTSGNIKILKASDGTVVTNLDLDIAYPNKWTTEPFHHVDTDADWDAVGNLYYLDDWASCWRGFSPPGTNQATTVALALVQVGAVVLPPRIQTIAVSGGTVTIGFTAGLSDTASLFTLLSSGTVNGSYSTAAGALITQVGPGSFKATVATSGTRQFYRISR
jgi:hypothetical protein